MPYLHQKDQEPVTTEEAFQALRVDDLKALARLLGKEVPNRKPELVALVTKGMRDPHVVRTLYEELDDTGKDAVREATYDGQGLWHAEQFRAKYGQTPSFGTTQSSYREPARPTALYLFFPNFTSLPVDLRELLLTFVTEPKPLDLAGAVDQPRPDVGQQSMEDQRAGDQEGQDAANGDEVGGTAVVAEQAAEVGEDVHGGPSARGRW